MYTHTYMGASHNQQGTFTGHVLHDHMITWPQLYVNNVQATATRDICDFISDNLTSKGNSIVGTVQGNLPTGVVDTWNSRHRLFYSYDTVAQTTTSLSFTTGILLQCKFLWKKLELVSHALVNTHINCFIWNATSWSAYSSATLKNNNNNTSVNWACCVLFAANNILHQSGWYQC